MQTTPKATPIFQAGILAALVFLLSCESQTGDEDLRQGTIEYHISYSHYELENYRVEHLPDKMVMKFRENTAYSKIEGFFGFFLISNLSNHRKDLNTTLLRVMDKKYTYAGKSGEMAFGFDRMENMEIELTDETKEICGYTCYRAKISFSDNSFPPYDVYYTEDIPIRNPNSTNPYQDIEGVLLEFQVRLKNLVMRLVATSINNKTVSDSDLTPPEGYNRISKADMENIIEKLLD